MVLSEKLKFIEMLLRTTRKHTITSIHLLSLESMQLPLPSLTPTKQLLKHSLMTSRSTMMLSRQEMMLLLLKNHLKKSQIHFQQSHQHQLLQMLGLDYTLILFTIGLLALLLSLVILSLLPLECKIKTLQLMVHSSILEG